MEFPRQFFKEMLGSHFDNTFSKVFPEIIKEALNKNDLLFGQDFVAIEEARRRYNLYRKTLYNFRWNAEFLPWISSLFLIKFYPRFSLPLFPEFSTKFCLKIATALPQHF
jgi:hypothetical protein